MSQNPNNGAGNVDTPVGSDYTLVDEVASWMSASVDLDSSGWERATPTPQMLRERNNRLRPIFEEGGEEYGEDAKTAEEMLHRRRQAIKIRNEQLFKAMKRIASARHVDLCFAIDATGSMERHIQGVKDAIRAIADNLIAKKANEQGGSKGTVDKLRLGLVAYRDYGDKDQYEVLPFTESVDEFHAFCSKLDAVGGGDRAEDVLGGLSKALEMNWSSTDDTKVIFHICDAPAHGTRFISEEYECSDRYPDGDPNGLTAEEIFEKIADRNIDYYFGKINKFTAQMVRVFSDALGDPIDQFDVKDILEICGSVIAAVSTSVGNSIRKTGPSARPERDYRIDETIPTSWDAYAIQNGKLLAYQFPRSVQDVVNDVPLDRCRPEIARIQMTADPFAKGTERLAYYARGLQTRRDVVLKDYRRLMSAGTERRQHEFANKLQTITSYFAALYMADCEEALSADKIPAILQFLMIKTLALGAAANVRYMSCEPRLDPAAVYIRFSNNHDFLMHEASAPARGVSVELLRFILAFSHYTYMVTDGKMMVVDLQGTIKPAALGGRPTVLLTDPAIHCEDRLRFGGMNHSKLGMKRFFENHACNEFCEALQLPAVDPSSVLKTN